MTTPKHSPTPWVSRSGGNNGRFFVEHKETKVPIALLDANVANGKNEANADFIVHAVNLHDDLVAKVSKLEADIEFYRKGLEKIAKASGITSPLELVMLAKNNEQTYVDILAEHIETLHRAKDQ